MERTGQRKVVRASGIKRRTKILEATLRVILRDGVRGVRHRAIAEEAQVPLASTTYYFKDIEELLSETFLFWNHRATNGGETVWQNMMQQLQHNDSVSTESNGCSQDASGGAVQSDAAAAIDTQLHLSALQDEVRRQRYIDHLSELASSYLIHQIKTCRDDHVIELAFQHEATRSEKLQRIARSRLLTQREAMEQFFNVLGSTNAEADGQITASLLLRLQHEAVMDNGESDEQKIQQIISRHISNTLMAISLSGG